jgi:hypothetical protein
MLAVRSVSFPPFPPAHLGTSDRSSHNFNEILVEPGSLTTKVSDPLIPVQAGGAFYAKLYEIDSHSPRYYAVGFRDGITDIGTVDVFFHPSSQYAQMKHEDYIGLGGAWSSLFRYVQYFVVQFAAASSNIVFIMPMVDSNSWPNLGNFMTMWREIINSLLVEVQKIAWPDKAGTTMDRNQSALENVVLSNFSRGRVAMGQARNAPGMESSLREIWDFDGTGAPLYVPARGQCLAYDQHPFSGDLQHFHVPPGRWERFPFWYKSIDEDKIHGHIPQRLAYHAAKHSALGH